MVMSRSSSRVPWAVALRAGLRIAAAAASTDRPLMVNLTVTRRCNLACGYCVEYDHESPPVPLATLCERLDKIAEFGTAIVTLTGGEALLHPDIAAVVQAVTDRGMVAALNTNAYLLTEAHVRAFNRAGLYAMQISVDAVEPTTTTKKAWRLLEKKLRMLAATANFRVRINTVLGASNPEEALEVTRRAIALGFDAKCALLRQANGELAPLDAATQAAYARIRSQQGRALGLLQETFNDTLLATGRVEWKCRAGARVFHVCENGLVHYCTPRFSNPATPLAAYTRDHIRTAFATRKHCTARCPVAYAHQASALDRWRSQAVAEPAPRAPRVRLPVVA